VKAQAMEIGEEVTINAPNNFAMLLQHEIDHPDGKLYVDRIPGQTANFCLVDGLSDIP
jgi:peptide deformylase